MDVEHKKTPPFSFPSSSLISRPASPISFPGSSRSSKPSGLQRIRVPPSTERAIQINARSDATNPEPPIQIAAWSASTKPDMPNRSLVANTEPSLQIDPGPQKSPTPQQAK
jgi:hypothetical protein